MSKSAHRDANGKLPNDDVSSSTDKIMSPVELQDITDATNAGRPYEASGTLASPLEDT